MPRLSSSEVFTPTSYPTHTYVVRDDLHQERLLREWIRQSTQIASVSGPSKVGKTMLVERVVGEGNLITVSGASVRTADQLWDRVLDWWGEPHATTASNAESSTDSEGHEKQANIGVVGLAQAGGRTSSGNQQSETATTQATVNRRGLPQVVQELANTPYTILLDDFHYIPTAIQNDVAQQLKDASAEACASASRACRTAPTTSCARYPSFAAAYSRLTWITGIVATCSTSRASACRSSASKSIRPRCSSSRSRPRGRRSSCSRSACGCATTSA
jgi:hypothetical protein